MTDALREKAAQSQGLVEEVNATVLPEPADANAIVPLAKADAAQSAEIQKRMAEIDVTDGPNDVGMMFERPGKLSDALPSPYANGT